MVDVRSIGEAMQRRRALLDEEAEIRPGVRQLVEGEFRQGAAIPTVPFRRDSAEVVDSPKLTLVIVE